jgi:hypothetical protein
MATERTVKTHSSTNPDMIPEGESIKPEDEDLDNAEGDEIPTPEDENQK